jgi:hypothetical protein
VFKRHKDYLAILESAESANASIKRPADVLESVVIAEVAGASIKRPAPSLTSPPTHRKRQKKNCPFAIAQRRAKMGAESVEVICPDTEIPNLEDKIVRLVDACFACITVLSVELQVCSWRSTP